MIPASFTAFKKSLKMDDVVRIVNHICPWHTRTTTIETKTLEGIQVIGNKRGRHGGAQMSSHIRWPSARYVRLIDDGVELLAERELEIWEWSIEYGGPVRNGLVIHEGEPFMRITRVGEATTG